MFSAPSVSSDSLQSALAHTSDSFDKYKKWIHSTYGEASKAKTITWTKYLRIHKVLSGRSIGERPKFKFWVKAKGFCFVRPFSLSGRPSEMSGVVIALPNKGSSGGCRRVAVVEEFFDIISSIHIGMGARNGKHAGQKRTYKAIMESYACLPREAVTHFLMSCEPCCSRMRLTLQVGTPFSADDSTDSSTSSLKVIESCSSPDSCVEDDLSRMSSSQESVTVSEGLPAGDIAADGQAQGSDGERAQSSENGDQIDIEDRKETPDMEGQVETTADLSTNIKPPATVVEDKQISVDEQLLRNPPRMSTPLKRAAEVLHASSPKSSKKGSDDGEDDDDDADDDDSLSTSPTEVDPERLKAFNMFCRLFVDENLDRLIPISKQPKEKLQSILDACNRQFPEFQERSRKRIRTYLKSCRRMRRARNMNGLDSIRPTPPHLTSPIAEGLLSQACENEMENSKRIKMGLEPLPATPARRVNNPPTTSVPSHPPTSTHVSMPSLIPAVSINQSNAPPLAAHRMLPDWRFQHAAPFRHDLTPFFGNGFFRPPFPGLHGPVPAALQVSQATAAPLGLQPSPAGSVPADLNSLKKQTNIVPSLANKGSTSGALSASEKATIRQLISGYRESATFLYRSADDLELLITHSG